jgi:hypothetical protein
MMRGPAHPAMAGGNRRPRATEQPQPAAPPLAPIVERMGPPVSRVPWSPGVVGQSLEILAVTLERDKPFWFKPVHAPSLRVGLPPAAEPGDHVLQVIGWYPLRPRVVHSTSWRYEEGRILLTYLAVVEPTDSLLPGSLEMVAVERAELDRGESMAPPDSIGLAAVLEHALRHLSWLVGDDPAIAAALPDWSGVLGRYRPEPFRSLS